MLSQCTVRETVKSATEEATVTQSVSQTERPSKDKKVKQLLHCRTKDYGSKEDINFV